MQTPELFHISNIIDGLSSFLSWFLEPYSSLSNIVGKLGSSQKLIVCSEEKSSGIEILGLD